MTDMKTIETLAYAYSSLRHDLADRLMAIEAEQRRIIEDQIGDIRTDIALLAAAEDELHNAIDDNHGLFVKPRTRVLHGVRCGLKKGKGKVEIDDQTATIRRIRDSLPEDQAELLVNVKESVDKRLVADLAAADLKRLGIRITDSVDAIIIKPVDGAVDRLIKALLSDALNEQEPQEAAA